MKHGFFSFLFLFLFSALLKGQSADDEKTSISIKLNNLSVGDYLPVIKIDHIIKYRKANLNLAELRGKLVIFDFFLTNCGSCISALPHLDSIQQRFKDQIQIFIVSSESEEKVNLFFSKNAVAKQTKIPIIVRDSVLNKLFKHILIPHEVWIGIDGRVTAITDAKYVTVNNIEDILSGKKK